MDKEQLIKMGKKMLLKTGKKALIIAIIIVLIAGAGYAVIINSGSYSKNDKSNTGYVTEEKISEYLSNDNVVKTSDGWKYNFDLDTMVNEIIDELEENHGILNNYISKYKQQEYLKSFIKADIITRYPDLRSADKIGTETADDEFQGCIQIQKALSGGGTKTLSFIDYDTFDSYVSSGNSEAANHFSLNEKGELVVAGWTRTTTNVTSNVPDVENIVDKVEYAIAAKPIKYKNVVATYSMPFDFLWALTVAGDNEDFAYEVSKLALNSKIVLTVQENFSVSESTTTEEYKIQSEIRKTAQFNVNYEDTLSSKIYKDIESLKPIEYKTVTKTKIENSSIKVNITEADTWILRYENTVTNTRPENMPSPNEPDKPDDTEYELEKEYAITDEFKEEIDNELEKYMISLCDSKKDYKDKKEKNLISGTALNLKHEKYSRTIDQQTSYDTSYTRNKYELGTADIFEKTDKESDEENFVTLFVKNREARNKILDAPYWFFEMLENSEDTASMLDLVKYLLYKATGKSYGITEYTFNVIDIISMTSVRGGTAENFIKAWENYSLWLYETNQSDTFPTNYLSADEESYIVYEDGSAGHNNIAYGWATFITNSRTSPTHSEYYKHPKYGAGYWNWRSAFAGVGVDVKSLYKGAYVDREAGKAVFKDIILPSFLDKVESVLANIPEYEFSRAQKDALTAVCYQYGNIGNFVSAFRESLNDDGTVDPEKIKNNLVVNGIKVFNYSNTIGDRKHANWYLFTEGKYIDAAGNEIRVSMADYAYMVADYFLNCGVDIHYAGSDVDIATNNGRHCVYGNIRGSWEKPVENPGTYGIVCATFVSLAIWQSGLIDEDTINQYGYNACGGVDGMLRNSEYADEWLIITDWDELEEGDIVSMQGHVFIYMDGEQCLDQNYCAITSGGTDLRERLLNAAGYRSQFICGYRYVGK